MNYLAHLHLASVTGTSKTGSLLGDFVKGQVESLPFDKPIKQGIQLHRVVDSFTDSHSFTKSLTLQLGELRRYGGIIIDVLYDHQLTLNFTQLHNENLTDFAQSCYAQLDVGGAHLPAHYIKMVNAMKSMDWLSGYGDMNNIERALIGISKRLKKPVDLTACLDWYIKNEGAVQSEFPQFYKELMAFAHQQASLIDEQLN